MELKFVLRTSLSIGGYAGSLFFDKVTARDGKGLPLLPATSIKGAFRVVFERLFPGETCNSPNPEDMCKPPNFCIACRIFGNPAREGKIRFQNALLQGAGRRLFEERAMGYEGRYGVALSRKLRTAEDKHLFVEEVLKFLPRTLEFASEIEGFEELDNEEREKFLQLLSFLKRFGIAIGGRKTAGYGWFDFDYILPGDRKPQAISTFQQAKIYRLSLKPREPFRVSPIKAREYLLPSLRFIPSSTAKGALALAAKRKKLLSEDEFNSLFLSPSSFISPLYPSRGFALSFPAPLSARTCKAAKGIGVSLVGENIRHGVKDSLLETFIISKITEKGIILPREEKCPCGNSLVPYEHYLLEGSYEEVSPSTRLSTKLALNRKTLTSQEGMLYSYELLDPTLGKEELTFCGIVSSPCQSALEKIATIKEIKIGGGRSRGMGKMELSLTPYISVPSMEERWEKLQKAVRDKAEDILGDLGLGKEFLKEIENRFYFSL
ncbi:MAG: RAMP superfamily CRISPR-associated protein, partial [bacterium]